MPLSITTPGDIMNLLIDHIEECNDLYVFLSNLKEADWNKATPFKSWTINQVVQHLLFLDRIAIISLKHPDKFGIKVAEFSAINNTTQFEGAELLKEWQSAYQELSMAFSTAPSDKRLPWFGPAMSLESLLIARQMEVWAHGQDVYDLYQAPRPYFDRIENICVLGIKTFSWSFKNRKLDVPNIKPTVRLTLPSGRVKTWSGDSNQIISGEAVEFASVVTQCRNIHDTKLDVIGNVAEEWMGIAQCFAGKPERPPESGSRSW